MTDTHEINNLNNILQYLHDSLSGYELNQEDISDPHLKFELNKLCTIRSAMIEDVKCKITELGGTPVDRGTVVGTLHQWYQDIKNAITGGDPQTIANQIRFGENFLLDAYKTALKGTMTPDIRQLLSMQMQKVEEGVKEFETEAMHSQ